MPPFSPTFTQDRAARSIMHPVRIIHDRQQQLVDKTIQCALRRNSMDVDVIQNGSFVPLTAFGALTVLFIQQDLTLFSAPVVRQMLVDSLY